MDAFLLSAVAAACRDVIAVLVTPLATATARRAGGRARMSGATITTNDAALVAEAVEGLLAALTRQRRPSRDPEPGSLSTFQSLALTSLVDLGARPRLGSLADALGTTDATRRANVDVLELHGFADAPPGSGDGAA